MPAPVPRSRSSRSIGADRRALRVLAARGAVLGLALASMGSDCGDPCYNDAASPACGYRCERSITVAAVVDGAPDGAGRAIISDSSGLTRFPCGGPPSCTAPAACGAATTLYAGASDPAASICFTGWSLTPLDASARAQAPSPGSLTFDAIDLVEGSWSVEARWTTCASSDGGAPTDGSSD